MSGGWQARRFWQAAATRPLADGWEVVLDDRPLRTPGKQPLILPTEALARALAAEWDSQGDLVDPGTMPLTRAANSALEKVAPNFESVAAMLAEYGGTDLLSYRAAAPADLVRRQAAGWDPLLDWAAADLGARLVLAEGVMPVTQDARALECLHHLLLGLDVFGLTALHDLVVLPGSLILGLAVIRGRISGAEAFALSRIDEDFQAEQWGHDAEAADAAGNRKQAILSSERFWHLSRQG